MKPGKIKKQEFELFRYYLKKNVGITLHPSKIGHFGRKLKKRLELLGFKSYTAYFRFIKGKEGEQERRNLINMTTIGQTSFFRGDQQFDYLCESILQELIKNNSKKRRLRIWSAGCSMGQEPYTVAMLIHDNARIMLTWDVKILATDIDSEALVIAKKGIYGEKLTKEVKAGYIQKYFIQKRVKGEMQYIIKNNLKKRLVFRRFNLLDFPYPMKGFFDIILCRNVMIYFDKEDKKKILGEFFKLLDPNGVLLLGGSESLLGLDDRFKLEGHAVYRKRIIL